MQPSQLIKSISLGILVGVFSIILNGLRDFHNDLESLLLIIILGMIQIVLLININNHKQYKYTLEKSQVIGGKICLKQIL